MFALELLIVGALIVLNGFLAMSELAVVSANRIRLQTLANQGHKDAARALSLAAHPGRFLSTVQIGITLAGVLAGAYSGATFAEPLAEYLEGLGVANHVSDTVALAIVVAAITFLSLILGELVPKQIGLQRADRIATSIAAPMAALSRLAAPLVWILDVSSRFVLRRLRVEGPVGSLVTEEEIKTLVAEAEAGGTVEPEETAMITRVMRLGDRPVRAIMTPRREVDWLDLAADEAENRRTIRRSLHSRLPVAHTQIDAVEGIVQTKDLLDAYLDGKPFDVRGLIKKAPVVHDGLAALDVVDILKASEVHVALVVDEHGTFEGIVTTADILEAIAGEFREAGEPIPSGPVQREDGSWLLDGAMPVEEMAAAIGVQVPEDRDYHTVAGFVLSHLMHLPHVGEALDAEGWRFEVVDTDGRRIDKVLARRR
jgi:putative hemolysin